MSRQFAEASESWDGDESDRPVMFARETMRVDLADEDDELVATIDLPGFEPNDVQVTLSDRTLQIIADREEEELDESDRQYIRQERHWQSLRRMIDLPQDVDEEGVAATMNNGVLTIRLPKLAPQEGRTIEIDLD